MTEEINKACEVLEKGGIILYPSDTIWGIGCDATNEHAVQRIYNLKQRRDTKAMLVLIEQPAQLERYVEAVPEIAWDLIEVADKPLTLIYDRGKNLAPGLVAADGSIGIRVTKEAFSQGLCRRFRRPIVSTSANVSGEASPANYAEIADVIKDGVDYIVDYRREDCSMGHASSIIRLRAGGCVEIIRQ
jgi:L-threonylcarbamoyladenylate synthase